jgi:hypothetical protein
MFRDLETGPGTLPGRLLSERDGRALFTLTRLAVYASACSLPGYRAGQTSQPGFAGIWSVHRSLVRECRADRRARQLTAAMAIQVGIIWR